MMRSHLSQSDLRRQLRRQFRGMRFMPGVYSRINLPDRRFDKPGLSDVHAIIDWAGVFRMPFMAERFDCDNFAKLLSGLAAKWCARRSDYQYAPALGHLWGHIGGRGHAVNWVLLDTGRIWLIEPQQQRLIYQPKRPDVRRITLIET